METWAPPVAQCTRTATNCLRRTTFVVLPPGDGLPAVRRQGREDGLRLVERGWARLLGLAASRVGAPAAPSAAARTSAGRRTPKVLLIPTT